MPSASLHLVSLENRDRLDIEVVLNIAEYEQWLARRLSALVDEAVRQEKQYNKRKRLAQKVELPFQQARCGQQELMQEIEEGFNRNTPILVQAPTGLGKTMSVLLPSLKDALKRGQKLIYVTPKNSVHLVAEEAVERLRRHQTKIKSLTLTAKAKLCLKSEQICDPNVCEFAKDYYDKVADNGLIDKVAKAQHMSPQLFTEYGKKYTVCPFELSIDCIDRADVVICDYNHIFAPISLSGRLTAAVHLKKEKPNRRSTQSAHSRHRILLRLLIHERVAFTSPPTTVKRVRNSGNYRHLRQSVERSGAKAICSRSSGIS
jgi:DNA excision repair protein ERCC-2